MKNKKLKPADNQRAHVYFSGRVQGVGFRYTAEQAAMDLDLKGWVKNLPDGRVEVVCEGPKNSIEEFFQKIKASHLGVGLKKIDCRWEKASHEFSDFRVEFYY